eukprot:CAMPEP_0194445006 /NCGR_PEP_ID=MMETSP0176-20130528/127605_1 /TAXON_ID=216777 /ORGANISM="Proboscia alata, Strain PI-D3" /LENGTH=244 /DNA_ID=CAMNT_0039271491 /DNA_START=804 /DNA_END=1539 /DNA_ORIENTATION=-
MPIFHTPQNFKTHFVLLSLTLSFFSSSNGGRLANGTFRAALQQPRIDAVHVKGMEAGYRSYGIAGLVRFQTDWTALGWSRYGGHGRIGGMVVGGDGRALSSSCFPTAGGTHRAPHRIILPPSIPTPQQIILLPHNGLGTPFNLLPAHGIQPSLIPTPQQIIIRCHNGLGTPFNLLPAHTVQPSGLIRPARLLIVPQQPLVIIPIEITVGEHQPQRVSGYWRFTVVHPGRVKGGHETLQRSGIGC